MATSLEDILVCPISLQLFADPVTAEDGHTYERNAIIEWIRLNGTSPLTRQTLTIEGLRPNFILKKMVEQFEVKLKEKKFHFKLNVDVRREKRALFQTFGKTIYKAEWINSQEARPPIIILKIDGARANKEASFYVDLSRHPHIVRTYGLVEDIAPSTSSIMLLQEYASEGSLFELLNDEREAPGTEILEEMFIQITDAMIFLAYNGIVHGDLVCRNVLIFRFDPVEPKRNLVKLTDFGLSRFSTLYSSVTGSASATTIHIIPTRTAAPEILINNSANAYTEMSDVFSMGLLMLEALNKGAMPWGHVHDDHDVRRMVIAGDRPPRPQAKQCTDKIWTIISNCWVQSPSNRPTFKELREQLTKTKVPSDTRSSASVRNRTVNPNIPRAASISTVPKKQRNQQSNSTIYPNSQVTPSTAQATNGPIYSWSDTTVNSNFVTPSVFINNTSFSPHVFQQISGRSSNTSDRTQNNGQHTEQIRNISNYHAIEVSGTFKIILTTDGPEMVKLAADPPQLLACITTTVENGTLKLTMNNSGSNIMSSNSSIVIINNNLYSPNNMTGTVTAYISGARQMNRLTTSGSVSIVSQNTLIADSFQIVSAGTSSFSGSFNVKKLNMTSSGCSEISFSGSSDVLQLSISGNSSCNATTLISKNVHIETSGSSNVELKGSADSLTLSASGSSSCTAFNFIVKTIRANTSGSSSARFHCTETLESSSHGASSIQYRGSGRVLKGSARKIS